MRVLVACEFSGIVRDAFLAAGHDAMSCDLLPTDRPGPHYQGDVFDVLDGGWDMLIAHPPCTYLANSGVRWLHTQDGRWAAMEDGARFFRGLLDAPIPLRAIENPIMHKYALAIVGRRADQYVQPWWFGAPRTKATGLWLAGLSPLVATAVVDGRDPYVHHLPPSPDRWKLRSMTEPGLAEAMATQWGIPAMTERRDVGRSTAAMVREVRA